MESYTIGEVADRSGFSASALRYYEGHGLLEPVGRTDAGYRRYDDTSLERLGFIARAKELGCTLEEISDLAESWTDEECAPVQARLHELVTAKIADAQRRSG
jgi:MerR family copper efflux transcriptional regulator